MESEPLIESAFRRLLVAIDQERESLRAAWKVFNEEQELQKRQNIEDREETEAWCASERARLDASRKEFEIIKEKAVMLAEANSVTLALCVSGEDMDVPSSVLIAQPDSILAHMLSKESIGKLPMTADGNRYVLDFHPGCFRIIVDHLHAVSLAQTAKLPEPAIPIIPASLRIPMAVMVDALKLDAFTPLNTLRPDGTSLSIEDNRVAATCQGWQVVSALHSMNSAKPTCFSVKIIQNPDTRGGLAIGLVGKPPSGGAVHQIAQPTGLLYNSNNGVAQSLVLETNDARRGLPFTEGSTVTVKFVPKLRKVQWFLNGQSVGHCIVKAVEDASELFPCFALFSPGQVIRVDFRAAML
eukprot:GEMP01057001.1.p1 GENE.GEMP01057001.1~~GEMP01057001.1.p1  ORF type:complete len:355 (+),score=58.13 GEMP01057001.1:40-1104(+)